MASEEVETHPDSPAPTRKVRMACWWGTILMPNFGFILLAANTWSPPQPPPLSAYIFLIVATCLCAPAGLAWIITSAIARVAEPFGILSDDCKNVIELCVIPLGCLFFYLHGRQMWHSTKERDFQLLMISLILLVVGGVIAFVNGFCPITD